MNAAVQQVKEIELHGYLDGELGVQRSAEVEDYLDCERAAAERLVHYGVQGDLIRRLYGPLINRPMPPQMAGRFQSMNERRFRLMNRPKPESGRSKGRKTPVVIFVLLSFLALGAALWFFQPVLLEQIPTMIEALLAVKLSSLWP